MLGQDLGARELVAIALVVAASIGVDAHRSAAPATPMRPSTPDAILRPIAPCSASTLPNFLTLLRILLVPVLVVALLGATTGHGDVLAAIVFALASLTDAIDGWLARSRESITTFGKLMDPVADKLLIIAALLSLVSLDRARRVGRDGDHRARVRGHRRAAGGAPGGRRDPRELVGQGQDARAGADDLPADRCSTRRRPGSTRSST